MRCARCGDAAVVQREDAYFCGRCALHRDWEEIVRLVQQMDAPDPGEARAAAASGVDAVPARPAPSPPSHAPTVEAPHPPADPFG